MANRMKEDEKNERIIRGLLKQPENRRCINCNSLGPQYVCTNFWTFLCTTCSGIHREFTHRVKSVSMAKFTSQEVSALQAGGNERAKEIYFKEWDPQRHSFADSSNVERLRDFIKHVYVDRRYTGERIVDKPPRMKTGDRDDSYENRRADNYRGGPGSPPYEGKYDGGYGKRSEPGERNDDRNFRYNHDERRSPGYDQESQRYGAYRRSPVRFEVVDDRIRDDRFGNGRRSEDRKFSEGESKLDGTSPNHIKDVNMSSPPVVRPVRDILGDSAPPLRIGEPPKANGGRIADGFGHTQKNVSSSGLGSVGVNSLEHKKANPVSLIDFDADPEPPATSAAPQTQAPAPIDHSVPQPVSSVGGNWASFDFASQGNVSQASSNANALESVLSQLSVPAPVTANNTPILPNNVSAPVTAPVDNMSILPIGSGSTSTTIGNVSMFPVTGGTSTIMNTISTMPSGVGAISATPGGSMPMLTIGGGDSFIKANDAGQWPNMQQNQTSFFPAAVTHSSAQQLTPSAGVNSNNQPWNSFLAQGPLSTPTLQSSQAVSKPKENDSTGVVSQPHLVEAKSSRRSELPENLFAANYSSVPGSVPGWRTVPPQGMGLGMQYPTAAPVPTFPHSLKSTNPFDLNSGPTLVPTPTFPSMATLQGALPNISAPTGLMRTASLGTPSPRWMAGQSPSYSSVMPTQSTPYMSTLPPSAYMGQQLPGNVQPFGHQGAGGFAADGAVFGTTDTNQYLGGRYSAPATPHSFSSVGGNPFG